MLTTLTAWVSLINWCIGLLVLYAYFAEYFKAYLEQAAARSYTAAKCVIAKLCLN